MTKKPFVRLYSPEQDEAAVVNICKQTVHQDLLYEPVVLVAPLIWALPYVRLEPEFCFVLDAGDDTAVGYIIGTPNNKAFLERYLSDYIPTIDEVKFPKPCFDVPAKWEGDELQNALLQLLYAPEDELGHVDFPELLDEYPGHLHIDLLPEFQGRGFGKQLMDVFLERMRDNEEGKGVHLVMAGDNINAEGFYMHLGFERYKAVLDDGKSGELGRHGNGNLWLTKLF